MKGLVELKTKYPQIAEVRGRGLMVAVEFDGQDAAGRLVEEGYKEDLLLITAGIKQTVRLLPPLCISEDEVDLALEKLDKAMGRVFAV